MDEILDYYDDEGVQIGKTQRYRVHKLGLWHDVVHCWIVSGMLDLNGNMQIYFQQRAFTKNRFPGLYDIAVGGHVGAGEDFLTAILREMREETGVIASSNEVKYLGIQRESIRLDDFYDREIAHVYLYRMSSPVFNIGVEVERMIYVNLKEYVKMELEAEPRAEAITLDGKKLSLPAEAWCWHEGEFESLVLPELIDN